MVLYHLNYGWRNKWKHIFMNIGKFIEFELKTIDMGYIFTCLCVIWHCVKETNDKFRNVIELKGATHIRAGVLTFKYFSFSFAILSNLKIFRKNKFTCFLRESSRIAINKFRQNDHCSSYKVYGTLTWITSSPNKIR